MKNTNKILFVSLFVGACILALAAIIAFKPVTNALASSYVSQTLSVATTSKAVAVTSSTRILATTTNPLDPTNSYIRAYASICNPSATLVYLNMNADKPADTSHAVAVIGAAAGYNVCYEITDRNLYVGSVQASSTNQTSVNVLVTSYVY
jgi:hypothetical protein